MDLGVDGDTGSMDSRAQSKPTHSGSDQTLPDWALACLPPPLQPQCTLPFPQGKGEQGLIDFNLLQVPPSHLFTRWVCHQSSGV